ncbi:hypothetical protein IB286_07875 [Spongiibacter sp. KMU-158]|uniref:Uncharacterized protein n=1 Tax=Spongiibacter pelagi TaxID=2760804 RepID=A0A927C0D7_9GAMM|nr:DUF6587 family protein [Spongiibacter pelagi]MBD2858930.1 hypothetical protein [Spongiibacter pelagi]
METLVLSGLIGWSVWVTLKHFSPKLVQRGLYTLGSHWAKAHSPLLQKLGQRLISFAQAQAAGGHCGSTGESCNSCQACEPQLTSPQHAKTQASPTQEEPLHWR